MSARPEPTGRRTLLGTAAWILVSVSLPAALAIGASALFYPVAADRVQAQRGAWVFRDRCASCHSVEPGAQPMLGPNLSRIGAEGASRRPGMTAAGYILESILDPDAFEAPGAAGRMPPGTVDDLSDSVLRDLVAYLAARGAPLDYRAIRGLGIERPAPRLTVTRRPDLARVERGRRLFFGQAGCSGCHSVYREPGHDLWAPGLHAAGKLDPAYVVQSITNPGAVITPGYALAEVTLDSGEHLAGRLLALTPERVSLLVRDPLGHPRLLDLARGARLGEKQSAISVQVSETSPMPMIPLPHEAIGDLTAFLRTFSGDPGGGM